MAYTPINWQTGDTITAEKMNKMDNGWSVETTSTTVFDGSVTTADSGEGIVASLTLTGDLSRNLGSRATITFNGTAYNVICFDDGGFATYGGSYGDFSTYPFNISYVDSSWSIYTESAGTYAVNIIALTSAIEISDDFQAAVQTAKPGTLPFRVLLGTTTWQEVYDAVVGGRAAYVIVDSRLIQYVMAVEDLNYSIICSAYTLGAIATVTYSSNTGTADGVLQA